MTRQERNQYLPVMRALEKVMATSTPAPEGVNTLLILTRDLTSQIPEGQSIPSFLGAGFGGFGLNGLENMGLAKTGDVIVDVNGVPHIVTQFGAFPLSQTSLMTDEERARFRNWWFGRTWRTWWTRRTRRAWWKYGSPW